MRYPILSILAYLCMCGEVAAVEVALTPTKDNTLFGDFNGNLSNGSGIYLYAGLTQQADGFEFRRALVAFDVASTVPAGSTIDNVTLTMRVSNVKTGLLQGFTVHRVENDWGEGDSDSGEPGGQGIFPSPGDATWFHTFWPSSFWNTPGGDFAAADSGFTFIGNVGLYSWSSAGMAADVQSWLDDPPNNFGWLIRGTELANGTARRFNSRENPFDPPLLVIEFTPPSPDFGACCFLDGVCSILQEGDCTAASGTFNGPMATCFPNPCPQPFGACCDVDDSCQEITAGECLTAGVFFHGPFTTCAMESCDGFCTELSHCADNDGDGIRDDNCVWWVCDTGVCVGTDIVFADMGGQFGDCVTDGTADGNDRFQALNCFSNTDPNNLGEPFVCEDNPPAALNVDAGGQFGSCIPDGVCDGNDAFHALNAFEGSSTCSCSPAPIFGEHEGSNPRRSKR